jgi:hypothetical protein
MKATPFVHPNFTLMKQTDIQAFFHMQMPRWLFFDIRYNTMSLEAKVAYTFLFNRFQLSKLNGWINRDGEVFIIYTRNSLSAEMQISYRKVISAMKELSSAKLIYERRCGRGDANQIYLAKVEFTGEHDSGRESAPFVSEDTRSADMACLDDDGIDADDAAVDGKPMPDHEPDSRSADIACHDFTVYQNCDKQKDTSGSARQNNSVYRDSMEYMPTHDNSSCSTRQGSHLQRQDMPIPHIKTCDSGTLRDAKTACQDMPNRHSSYTDISNTEKSDTDNSQSVNNARGRGGTDSDEINELRELDDILDGCELWTFPDATARVFENAIERLFFSEKFRIGNAVLPRKKMRSHLHLLDSVKLQDAAHKLAENREHKVKNSTAYVMAVVFNSIWESDSDVLCDPYINSLAMTSPLQARSGDSYGI